MLGGWRTGRHGRVLASLLVVTGLLGVGVVPAGAGPALPADDVPQPPEEIVPYVPELIDFGLLRDELREKYKDTFAGLVNDGEDSITIYQTRTDDDMRDHVRERFEDAGRRSGDESLVPEVTYRTTLLGGLSLDSLFGLKDTIMAATGLLKPLGVNVETIGVQDSTNKLIIGVSSAIPLAQRLLEQLFGRGHLLVIPWKLTEEADRWNDSPPWNGGDQLVTEGSIPGACTSGFGVHDGSGNHYVTTAGHCGTHFWWNTNVGFPIRNSSTLVGVTSGSVWNGTYFGYDVDTQKILTNGSSNIVWTGTSTRRYISAPLDVAQGDPTCIEGSFSLTKCGTIWATDFGGGGTQYLVHVGGATTFFGDSGAPSWRNSPFGPLAQGTHVGSLSNNLKVELNIYAVMFFNGVQLNTPFDP
jgi:hypothetical protein